VIAQVVVLAGAVLILLAAGGVVRFPDVLARMHALTKASTLGLLLVLIGAAVSLSHPNDYTTLALAAALQILTSPVSAHLIGRATYLSHPGDYPIDAVDELADDELTGDGLTGDGLAGDGLAGDGLVGGPIEEPAAGPASGDGHPE
jgi:multicomponent Na+:H+ antiporter subunit G